jgi:hypothetical protein
MVAVAELAGERYESVLRHAESIPSPFKIACCRFGESFSPRTAPLAAGSAFLDRTPHGEVSSRYSHVSMDVDRDDDIVAVRYQGKRNGVGSDESG